MKDLLLIHFFRSALFVAFFNFCFRCCEKESLDGTLRRFLTQKEVSLQKNSSLGNNVGQGLWCSLKLLRGDIKQVCLAFKYNYNITSLSFPSFTLHKLFELNR
jgi:hypothetical protein